MAVLTVEGIDVLLNDLEKINPSPAELKMLLQAGAEVFKTVEKNVAAAKPHELTGKMIQNIDAVFVSEKEAHVYPLGVDTSKEGRHSPRHPVRNAEKAFIAHYGRKKQTADYWVEDATDQGELPVTKAMQTKFNEILQTKGLI